MDSELMIEDKLVENLPLSFCQERVLNAKNLGVYFFLGW
jgi:hypothetical protein